MVRLVIIVAIVLLGSILLKKDNTQNGFTYKPPSVITVETLPPIEEIK